MGAFNAGATTDNDPVRLADEGTFWQSVELKSYNWNPGTGDVGIGGYTTSFLGDITPQKFLDDYLSTTGSTVADFYTEGRETLRPSAFAKAFRDYIGDQLESAGATGYKYVQHTVNQTMTFDPQGDYTDGRRWSVRWNWAGEDTPIAGDAIDLKGFNTTFDMDSLEVGNLDLGTGTLTVFGALSYTGTLTVGTGGATVLPKESGTFYLNGYTGSNLLSIETTGGAVFITGTVSGALDLSIDVDAKEIFGTGNWYLWQHRGVAQLVEEGNTTTIGAGRTLRIGHNCIGGSSGGR